MSGSLDIRLKRVYDKAAENDGHRVLVDRIWPRGISKEKAKVDEWLKDLGPSTDLRKWFDHDPEKFDRFRDRYIGELDDHRDELAELRDHARDGRLTLVYSAKDEEHNQAVVIAEVLRRGLRTD